MASVHSPHSNHKYIIQCTSVQIFQRVTESITFVNGTVRFMQYVSTKIRLRFLYKVKVSMSSSLWYFRLYVLYPKECKGRIALFVHTILFYLKQIAMRSRLQLCIMFPGT